MKNSRSKLFQKDFSGDDNAGTIKLHVSNAAIRADSTKEIRAQIVSIIERHLGSETELETPIKRLKFYGIKEPTKPISYLYEPCFGFIASGAKRVVLGSETYIYDESSYLLTALGLPTVVQVLGASERKPYFSIKLDIDLDLAKELISEIDLKGLTTTQYSSGIALGDATVQVAQSVLRLVELLDAPAEIPILATSIERELLYRILMGNAGTRLREIVQGNSKTNRISTASRWIRDNLEHSLNVKQLAQTCAMAESTFYGHFKTMTNMSPLQYQKSLRLHKSRKLLLEDDLDVNSVALLVGYESVTQFTREYRRQFGAPPRQDVRSLKRQSMELKSGGETRSRSTGYDD